MADNGLISEREFDAIWGVFVKESGDFLEFRDVCDRPLRHVWTVVDTGDDDVDTNWYALPGLHIVNKLGYAMTKIAWSDDTPDAVYYFDNL